MKKEVLKYAKIIISAVVFCLLFYYIYLNRSDFTIIFDLDFIEILALSLLVVASVALSGLAYCLAIKNFGIRLRAIEWINLAFINRLSNYFLSKSGIAARSLYLKQKHGLPFATIIIIGFYLLGLQLAASLIMLLTAGLLGGTIDFLALFFILLVTLALLSLYLKDNKIIKAFEKKTGLLSRHTDKWHSLNADRTILKKLAAVIGLMLILDTARIYFLYLFLYEPISLSGAIVINSFVILSFLISVTPAGIGIRESLSALGGALRGLDYKTVVVAAVADRAIAILWIFVIGIPAMFWYAKHLLNKNKYDK